MSRETAARSRTRQGRRRPPAGDRRSPRRRPSRCEPSRRRRRSGRRRPRTAGRGSRAGCARRDAPEPRRRRDATAGKPPRPAAGSAAAGSLAAVGAVGRGRWSAPAGAVLIVLACRGCAALALRPSSAAPRSRPRLARDRAAGARARGAARAGAASIPRRSSDLTARRRQARSRRRAAAAAGRPIRRSANRIATLEGELKALAETVGVVGRRSDEIAHAPRDDARKRADADAPRRCAELREARAAQRRRRSRRATSTRSANRVAALEQTAKALEAELGKRAGGGASDRAVRLARRGRRCAARSSAAIRSRPSSPPPSRSAPIRKALAPLEPFAATGRAERRRARRANLSALAPALRRPPAPRRATAASSTGCRPMPRSSCASARSTRRRATIPPRSLARIEVSAPRRPISPAR